MIDLLKFCGYKEREIESELPRVEKAFGKLGINADDIEQAKQRLVQYYDMELVGVRKIFRLCLRELVDSLLVREESRKKVIYGFMSPGMDIFGSVLVSNSKEVYSVYHPWAFHIVDGCIFGKMVPSLEEAENKWLKVGAVTHCANVKSLVGPIVMGLFPKPDLLVTSGFLCETSSKTLDLLHELYDIPVWFVDTCLDRELQEYPEPSKRIISLAVKSMKRLAGRIQEVVGFEITDNMLREVQNAKGKLNDALNRLRKLIENSDPLPISPAHDNISLCLNSLTLTIDGIAEATEAINTLCEELQERIAKGIGVTEKGAPRVMATLPNAHADPRLDYLACKLGIAIVATDVGLSLPINETSEDPYVQLVSGILQGSMGLPLRARIPLIIEGCKKYNVAGVLDRSHVGCRTVTGDTLIIEEAIKKELGIPVLLLEWENFDPRIYKHEDVKNRLEIFRDMMTKKSN